MPITVQATEGLLSTAAEQALFAELTELFLQHHALSGNAFLAPNVIGEVNTIPQGRSFAGGRPASIVIVELKVPSFALATDAQKAAFVADATAAVERAAGGRLPRGRIYVNMVYAVDGLWGIGGRAFSNAALIEAVSRAA